MGDQVRGHGLDRDRRDIEGDDIEIMEGVNGRRDIEIERGREDMVILMERIERDREIVIERDINDDIDIGMRIENEESIDQGNGKRMEQRMRLRVIMLAGIRMMCR